MKKLLIISALCISLASCGDSAEHRAAVALDAKIDSCLAAKDYAGALTLIDSLNASCPRELEIRRATAAKRYRAMEGMALVAIPGMDSLLAVNEMETKTLEEQFVEKQTTQRLAPYCVERGVAKVDFAAAPCIQPRVNTGSDARDTPWLLAVNAGRNIGLKTVALTLSNGETVTAECLSPDGQTGTVVGARLNAFFAGGARVTGATLMGKNGKVNIKVNDATSTAIEASYNLARLRTERFDLLAAREKTERQLQIARDKLANT